MLPFYYFLVAPYKGEKLADGFYYIYREEKIKRTEALRCCAEMAPAGAFKMLETKTPAVLEAVKNYYFDNSRKFYCS